MAPIEKATVDFKAAVRSALGQALKTFEAETGLSPSAITVQMVEMTTYGDSLPRYTLADVGIKLDL